MKIWTYREMQSKILRDLDLEDETFISKNEMVGYFNEAITEAGSEIESLNKEYFLTKYYLPVVSGASRYALPPNIFANKIRGLVYQNGSIIYQVKPFGRRNKFEDIAFSEQYGQADDYRYLLDNNVIGQAQLKLHPASRDTAILSPSPAPFVPFRLWYIRDCARIPMVAFSTQAAEQCNPEILATTQVDTALDQIQTFAGTTTVGNPQEGEPGAYPGSIAYITGDQVQFQPGPNGTLPAPLVAGVIYYVIAGANGLIKLATSMANALAGTAIDLTTVGSVYHTMTVAATQNIVHATLIDIPEFATFIMQWVKCRCMEKEGDPRLDNATMMLAQQKKQMIDSLTNAIPDDNDEIQPDFSAYQEMS